MSEDLTAEQLVKIADKALKPFSGDVQEFGSAVGALTIARKLGWRPLLLMYDARTIRKYEKILGVTFRDLLPEEGEWADKSIAWKTVQKVGGYWKAVKSEIPGIRSNKVD